MEEMFREHWSLVLGYLTTRVRDRSLAEELAAETFYRATRAFLGWRGESPPAWLLAIARNVLIDAVPPYGSLVASFYENPFAGARNVLRRDGSSSFFQPGLDRPVAWPVFGPSLGPGIQSFDRWTRALRSSDDDNLERLGLPGSAHLKALGAANLVHGLLMRDLTPVQLTALLANPEVATFTPVTVRFDILNKDQS